MSEATLRPQRRARKDPGRPSSTNFSFPPSVCLRGPSAGTDRTTHRAAPNPQYPSPTNARNTMGPRDATPLVPTKKTTRKTNRRGKPGPVRLEDVAETLGVSTGTVSLILNRSPASQSIPEETHQRVRASAELATESPGALLDEQPPADHRSAGAGDLRRLRGRRACRHRRATPERRRLRLRRQPRRRRECSVPSKPSPAQRQGNVPANQTLEWNRAEEAQDP